MAKVELAKQIASYTAPRGRFEIVTVPPLRYLMIDGRGDPNTSAEYERGLQTIFPVAYKLKFLSRNELDRDYAVMPLEALWWSADPASFTSARDKSQWEWTLLELVPDWLTEEQVESALQAVGRKNAGAALDRLRLDTLDEGSVAQTLHVGSYEDEEPVLAALHGDFLPAHALQPTGKHHEIYLSDPRRTAPEKLKTILRQPVAPAG